MARMTRRNFLKGAAATVAVATALSVMPGLAVPLDSVAPSPKRKVCVDLFCGGGGLTAGLMLALQDAGYSIADVDFVAVNHWKDAINTHSLNHPTVHHILEDVAEVDPRKVVPGGYVDLLMAAAECTHHSNARGGKPMNDQSRSGAWHILRWLSDLYVKTVLIENVREWANWGPLNADGRPDKSRKGEMFRAFIVMLESMGYKVDYKVINSADLGGLTTRKRIFLQARRDDIPISWPKQTHAKAPVEGDGLLPWRAVRDAIDWTLRGKSIYNRKRPLAANTHRRVDAGLRKFGGMPFLVPNHRERDGQTPRTHDAGQPAPTVAATGWTGLVEPCLINMKGESNAADIDGPAPTQTTSNHLYLAQPRPYLVVLRNNCDTLPMTGPAPTLAAGGNHVGICEASVEPFVLVNRTHSDAHAIDDPTRTLTTGGNLAVIESFLIGAGGPEGQGRNPEGMDGPVGTLMTENHRAVINPCIITVTHSGGGDRAYSVDDPSGTITGAHRGEFALVDPYLVKYYEGSTAASVDDPSPAITANYEHIAVAEPFLAIYHNGPDGDKRVQGVDDPAPTLDTSNRVGMVRPFLIAYYGNSDAVSIDDPSATLTGRDRYALVHPDHAHLLDKGQIVAILDITIRMLQPHELAKIMGFSEEYYFVGTREAKVKQIGNAVEVCTARALCRTILEAV